MHGTFAHDMPVMNHVVHVDVMIAAAVYTSTMHMLAMCLVFSQSMHS